LSLLNADSWYKTLILDLKIVRNGRIDLKERNPNFENKFD
jgi:hypothetical protein